MSLFSQLWNFFILKLEPCVVHRAPSVTVIQAGRDYTVISRQQPRSLEQRVSPWQLVSARVQAASECSVINPIPVTHPSLDTILLSMCRCVKGACVAVDAHQYRCDCEDGYEGVRCHLRGRSPSWCGGLHCVRGQCEQVAGVERCVCEEGYSGQNCDIGEDRQTDRLDSPSGT